MNGLFKFNEKDYVAGFYRGVTPVKYGQAMLLSTLDGSKVVGVPCFTTINQVPDKVEEGSFLLLQLMGMEKSKNTGKEYMNISSRAWVLEEEEKMDWDKEKCNVTEVLDLLPDYSPDGDSGTPDTISDDDLPF